MYSVRFYQRIPRSYVLFSQRQFVRDAQRHRLISEGIHSIFGIIYDSFCEYYFDTPKSIYIFLSYLIPKYEDTNGQI